MRAGTRGFTLLEVLVAIAILGLGMTSILSAQAGLFASSSYAERVSLSIGMVRCKMSELELKLAKEGYPLIDTKDEGPCCGDDPVPGYSCKWKIEKVELPPPPLSGDLSSKMSSLGSGSGPGALGSLGAIAAVGQSGGAVLGNGAGISDISRLFAGESPLGGGSSGFGTAPGISDPSLLGNGSPSPTTAPTDFGSTPFGSSAFGQTVPGTTPLGAVAPAGGGLLGGTTPMTSGTGALAPLVMSLVYPTLKPMLEASIRKVTVTVTWKEGRKSRDLEIVQFVTNPQQGGIDPNAMQGMDSIMGMLGPMLGGMSGAATGGTTK